MTASVTGPGTCTRPETVPEFVQREIGQRHLLHGISRLGLAVSGGADSVAMFHLLLPVCRNAGISVTVLHLNHGLRSDADADVRFVRGLADAEGLPFLSTCVNLASRANDGTSPEMAARTARMDFFRRCCADARLDAVATGHQADDVAETVLLRLARGAGATGLSGIRPVSRLSASLVLIRPLLSVSGHALRGWLTQHNRPWREDPTNRDDTIPRNYVRNALLPQLERSWLPDLRERLCQSAEALREDDAFLETLALRAREALVTTDSALQIVPLRQHPAALQRRILRQWLFHQDQPGFAGLATVLALLERCQTDDDWQYQLSGGVLAICNANLLRLQRTDTPIPQEAVVPVPGTLSWGPVEIVTEASCGVSVSANGVGCLPAVCSLSAEALKGRVLRVRARRPGDRIAPTGLEGSKKIQDLFVDEKVQEHQRDRIPLFVCGEEVVWVPGFRIARSFAVPTPDAPSIRISVRTC